VFALDNGNVVLALQSEPELCAVSKISPKAHGGIGCYRSALIEDIGDAARRHPEIECEAVRAQAPGFQLTP
jgi:hypothetical protein